MRPSTATAAVALLAASASALPHEWREGDDKNGWGGWGKDHGKDNHKGHKSGRKNVIFSISDGMGLSGLTLTRQYLRDQQTGGNFLDYGYELPLDQHAKGTLRTTSANTFITDSAGAGTALATGHKTKNGMLGVTPEGVPVGSVLEAAKAKGFSTGVVTNAFVTDATPGAFTSHATARGDYWYIAEQQLGFRGPLGHTTDVIIGSGFCPFVPQDAPNSCRPDDRDLLAEATAAGWSVARTPDEMRAADTVPHITVFRPRASDYEIDRNATEAPGLVEMTQKALDLLTKDTAEKDNGFFLMTEEGIIDYSGHDNDAVAQVSSVLNHMNVNLAIMEHLKVLEARGDETLVLATSDHETGGLGIGTSLDTDNKLGDYFWNPAAIRNAKHSGDYAASQLIAGLNGAANVTREAAVAAFADYSGITDATEEEIAAVIASGDDAADLSDTFNIAVSARARVGWTSRAHTSTDVPIYCYGSEYCNEFSGSWENVEIPQILARFLDVDVESVTAKLQAAYNSGEFKTNATVVLGEAITQADANHPEQSGTSRKRSLEGLLL